MADLYIPYDAAALLSELKTDEDYRLAAYRDQNGNWTVGIGHNISADGIVINDDVAMSCYAQDVAKAEGGLDKSAPWWRKLPDAWQRALVNLCFNMGWGDGKHGLSSFTTFLSLVQAGNYDDALTDLSNTAWARQTSGRFGRIKARVTSQS